MRVVHVPFGYFPDDVGGTEVYVADLVRGLRTRGIDSIIAAPSVDGQPATYEHDGTMVHRFGVNPDPDVAALYGEGDDVAARAIGDILGDAQADVLHLHAFTRAASLRAARVARSRGVAVVFTYHTPTASCVRGTLLHDGHEPCDGALIAQRCTSCLLQSHGVPPAVRHALSHTPAALGSVIGATGVNGRWVTAVRARELTEARHDAFRELLDEADAIVAVCEWVRALLVRAGAPRSRVMLSRQGTGARPVDAGRQLSGGPLKLAFAGRLHATKGIHIVLAALDANRDLDVTLDIFGVAQGDDGDTYFKQLASTAAADSRIRFRRPVPADRIVDTFAQYDATIVPSQWLETGPLTVLESFAAGAPVIGSNLGGIAELVTHDRDGWLVRHDDVSAWSKAIARFAADRALLERLRAGVQRPRSTDEVARDMVSVYESIVPRRMRAPGVVAAGVA